METTTTIPSKETKIAANPPQIGPAGSTPDLLRISDLTVQYLVGKSTKSAVENVSFTIPSTGYTIGVVGESGSGKTTTGLSIMRLIEPPGRISNGSIKYNGKEVMKFREERLRRFRWEDVAMVFQSAMNSLSPVKTVVDHIVEVLLQHNRKNNFSKEEARERAIALLEEVGISKERANAYPHELSGGMRQRVVIAMAMALSPKILIADEPTSALDVVVQQQILDLVKKEITERGLSLIFITHEIALLEGLVENVAVMFAGEIVEMGKLESVISNPKHPYTEMLLGSLLTLDSDRESVLKINATLGGETSQIGGANIIPKVGCKFANRCKYAFDRCRVEEPQLILRKDGNGALIACHKYSS